MNQIEDKVLMAIRAAIASVEDEGSAPAVVLVNRDDVPEASSCFDCGYQDCDRIDDVPVLPTSAIEPGRPICISRDIIADIVGLALIR
jgi:hypothetical protein